MPPALPVVRPTAAAGGPISHAIFRVARLHRELAGQLLRPTGLYPGQEILMMHLWDTGPQRQADLVRALDSDAATMTRTIHRLERAGFVRRTPSPTDRRATIIEATPASASLRTAVEQIWRRLEEITAAELDAAKRTASLDALVGLERNLLAPQSSTSAGRGPSTADSWMTQPSRQTNRRWRVTRVGR